MISRRSITQFLASIPFISVLASATPKKSNLAESHKADLTFTSYEDMKAAVSQIMTSGGGWISLPADDPRRGVIGVLVFRNVVEKDGAFHRIYEGGLLESGETSKEEMHLLEFPVFGTLEIAETYLDDVRLIQDRLDDLKGRVVYSCDDPCSRTIGFVHYDVPGVSTILTFPVKNHDMTVDGKDWDGYRSSLPLLRDRFKLPSMGFLSSCMTMGNAARVSGGGFEFDTCSVGGTWRWKVIANNTKGSSQTYFVSDIVTPFGSLDTTDVPIPGEVIALMADSLSQFQQQLAPLLHLISSPSMSLTVTEGDPITAVGAASFVNAGSFGSFMSVTATPGTPWMSANPSSILGIGKNESASTNVQVNPGLLFSSASPYSGYLNLQDNRNSPTVVQVRVDVTVLPRPTISVSATNITLSFNIDTQVSGGPQVLTVLNSGPATSLLSFKVSKIQNVSPWLVVSPLEGGPIPSGDTADLVLSVNSNGVTLLPGVYSETLKISSQNASNSQVLVTVTLVVS